MGEEGYRRYVHINLPHARTIVQRIGRSLDALGAFRAEEETAAPVLHAAFAELERAVDPWDDDPPLERALRAADDVAVRARALVTVVLETPFRGDRLGQLVRNLFECLGLLEEGAALSLDCGEREDSPLR